MPGDGTEAVVSERAGHGEHQSDSDGEERRVQFNKTDLKNSAASASIEDDSYGDDDGKKKLKG